MGLLNHLAVLQAVTSDGVPVAGALRYIYRSDADMLARIYQDSALTHTVANPMVADTNGEFGMCYLEEGVYRVVITDARGNTLLEVDDIRIDSTLRTDLAQSYTSVEHLLSDTTLTHDSMPAGETADSENYLEPPRTSYPIAAGTKIRVASQEFTYEVAEPTSADHHVVTAGGLKLYALPNTAGEVFTSQLGWREGTDISAKLISFFGCVRRIGIRTLRQDRNYDITGGGFVIPKEIVAWLSVDFEALDHGEHAYRSLRWTNGIREAAEANGLERVTTLFAQAPANFRFGGLRLDYNVEVDEKTLSGGGNGGTFFDFTEISGISFKKCRADFASGKLVNLVDCPFWRVEDCFATRQQFFINLVGRCDYGIFKGVRGKMGYQDLSNRHGDFIKTTPNASGGPRFCKIVENHLENTQRDGIDFTGGAHGWVISNNYFRAEVAALDLKQLNNLAGRENEDRYKGLTVSNNIFHGCSVIITENVNPSAFGSEPTDDDGIRDMVFSNNVHIGYPGAQYGYFIKTSRRITVLGDVFLPVKTTHAGSWDPTTGYFPDNAKVGTHYVATVNSKVHGLAIQAGDFLRPRKDGAATDNPQDWDKSSSCSVWVNSEPLRVGAGDYDNLVNMGEWDPTSGVFPSTATAPASYYKVTRAGVVDSIAFEPGDYLVSRVASPSATSYDDNWLRRVIQPWPIPSDIEFVGIRWDARGSNGMKLNDCQRVKMNFSELVAHRDEAISICGRSIEISGTINTVHHDTKPAGTVSPIYVAGGEDIRLRCDTRHHSASGRSAAIIVTGDVASLSIDGTFENFTAGVEIRRGKSIGRLRLGRDTGINVRNCNSLIRNFGTIRRGTKGCIELNGAGYVAGTLDAEGNLECVAHGTGPDIAIQGDSLSVSHSLHVIDTQSARAIDDLHTVSGGAACDTVMLACADASRVITVRNGIGNLVLASDRVLDDPAKALVLRKLPNGKWHEIGFYG